jgi:hypothetical protein
MAKRGADISDFKKQKKARKRTTHLLVIAIDQYLHCPPLYNCKRDAEHFIQLLTQKYQFDDQHLIRLYDEKATEEKILNALKSLIDKVKPEDDLVVIYSGHGEYEAAIDEGYWIPVDGRPADTSDYISNSRITKYIKAISAHHILFIVDSCFSGSLFATRKLHTPASSFRLDSIASRWLLTAGRNEVVADGQPGDNSPFADSILYFLEKNQKPSFSISELTQHVIQSVSYNARQTPRGEPLQDVGHRGGQFHFRLKGTGAVHTPVESPAIESPIVRPSPTPIKWRPFLIGGAGVLIISIISYFLFSTTDANTLQAERPSKAALAYDSLLNRAHFLMTFHEQQDSLLLAQNLIEEAIKIANKNTGLTPERAKQAQMITTNQLHTLQSMANETAELTTQTNRPPPTQKVEPQTPPTAKTLTRVEQEDQFWTSCKQQNTEEAYRQYLAKYPRGAYTWEAQEAISESYDYQLSFTTSVSSKDKRLSIYVSKGKPPFKVELTYGKEIIEFQGTTTTIEFDLNRLKLDEGRKIATIIVRDHNFKARGAKTMLY